MRKLITVVFFTALFPQAIYAEYRNCDGVWTNQECGNVFQEVFVEDQLTEDQFKEPKPQEEDVVDDIPVTIGAQPSETTFDDKRAGLKNSSFKEEQAQEKTPPKEEELILVSTRPEPVVRWSLERTRQSKLADRYKLSGTMVGHGKIKAILSTYGKRGQLNEKKVAWVKTFRLPKEGGEQSFYTSFAVPRGWYPQLEAKNIGRFSGYKLTRAQYEISQIKIVNNPRNVH